MSLGRTGYIDDGAFMKLQDVYIDCITVEFTLTSPLTPIGFLVKSVPSW